MLFLSLACIPDISLLEISRNRIKEQQLFKAPQVLPGCFLERWYQFAFTCMVCENTGFALLSAALFFFFAKILVSVMGE